jgi:hypothetical protein
MMSGAGLYLETLQPPQRYTDAQLDRAAAIAQALNRGKLVLCEQPQR